MTHSNCWKNCCKRKNLHCVASPTKAPKNKFKNSWGNHQLPNQNFVVKRLRKSFPDFFYLRKGTIFSQNFGAFFWIYKKLSCNGTWFDCCILHATPYYILRLSNYFFLNPKRLNKNSKIKCFGKCFNSHKILAN